MILDLATVLVACPYCGAPAGVACPSFSHVERTLAAHRTTSNGVS